MIISLLKGVSPHELVRLLLGDDACPDKKAGHGTCLCVLGIDVRVSPDGYSFAPSVEKVDKWCAVIKNAISTKALEPGCASKLGGQLSWGCSHMFRRFGRAMLRPVFDQKSRFDGKASPELFRALEWWLNALSLNIVETRLWGDEFMPSAHLFCDASGAGARMGAVLYIDGQWSWTSMVAPTDILESFRRRKDNQIMGLELLAISLGLGTFEKDLQGRHIVVHCDNTGAEVRTSDR